MSRSSFHRRVQHGFSSAEGASLLEVALLLPVLLLILVGTLDFGRAYCASIATISAAEAGAFYGVQNPGDAPGMILAAKLDGASVPTLLPVATLGCECADGSGSSSICTRTPSCSSNVVNYVEVDTTATYIPLLRYPGIPATITLKGTARIRVAQ